MINAIAKRLSNDNRKGFTLIETLVVLALLTMFTIAAIPGISGVLGDMILEQLDTDATNIAREVERLVDDYKDRGYTMSQITAVMYSNSSSTNILPSGETIITTALTNLELYDAYGGEINTTNAVVTTASRTIVLTYESIVVGSTVVDIRVKYVRCSEGSTSYNNEQYGIFDAR